MVMTFLSACAIVVALGAGFVAIHLGQNCTWQFLTAMWATVAYIQYKQ